MRVPMSPPSYGHQSDDPPPYPDDEDTHFEDKSTLERDTTLPNSGPRGITLTVHSTSIPYSTRGRMDGKRPGFKTRQRETTERTRRFCLPVFHRRRQQQQQQLHRNHQQPPMHAEQQLQLLGQEQDYAKHKFDNCGMESRNREDVSLSAWSQRSVASVTLPGSSGKSADSSCWNTTATNHSSETVEPAAEPLSLALIPSSGRMRSFLLEKYLLNHPPFCNGLAGDQEDEVEAASGARLTADENGALGKFQQAPRQNRREPTFEISSYIIADGHVSWLGDERRSAH